MKWILDHVEGSRERARRGELLFGTVDTWLIGKRLRAASMSPLHNASRTMLFNIHTLDWDDKMLKCWIFRARCCQKCVVLKCTVRLTLAAKAAPCIQSPGSPVTSRPALFLGQLCVKEGMAKNTYGTGRFMLMNTGEKAVKSEKPPAHHHRLRPTCEANYALEGVVYGRRIHSAAAR
ncbi:FGGY family carbohydrate kinase [Escherichia coli]